MIYMVTRSKICMCVCARDIICLVLDFLVSYRQPGWSLYVYSATDEVYLSLCTRDINGIEIRKIITEELFEEMLLQVLYFSHVSCPLTRKGDRKKEIN